MTETTPPEGRTRFAPAPTGYLHLGHVANAVAVWDLARARNAEVLLRIEDHDHQRSRPEFDAALLEDLAWLRFVADRGPIRQSDDDGPYRDALARLRADGLAYGCDCTRATAARWREDHGTPWRGPGCPGGCRERGLGGPVIRVALGGGRERWMDELVGPCDGEVGADGDLPVRDRHGNWTYGFSVVVDDLRQGIDLVVRGRDLLDATADQIRLGAMLGRSSPPTFAHHALIRGPDGRKLSKADASTSVRDLRAAGRSPRDLIDRAAAEIGIMPPAQEHG